MRFDIVTLFPRMAESPLSDSILKRARESGTIEVHVHDIRDHALDKHRVVDDTPYGGGAGMVMKPEPLVTAVESISLGRRTLRIFLTPQGECLNQDIVRELATYDQLVLICGRYEGVDERAREVIADRELSIGDYVVSGGELAAMVVVDAVTRLLPGALGNADSVEDESFEEHLLEYPHYTRPEVFRGETVPEVLRSGNHADIARWRHQRSLERTYRRRPDLLRSAPLSDEDRAFLARLQQVDKKGQNG
jgi:tRNA (guanine37-N1)-methyltransferase